MIIFLILGLLVGAAAVVFALQNITTVTVMFLSWQLEGSLALIIMLAIGVGILMSFLLSLPDIIQKSFQISGLKKHNDKLKDELTEKEKEVEAEKLKVAANNGYLDGLEKNPKI